MNHLIIESSKVSFNNKSFQRSESQNYNNIQFNFKNKFYVINKITIDKENSILHFFNISVDNKICVPEDEVILEFIKGSIENEGLNFILDNQLQ